MDKQKAKEDLFILLQALQVLEGHSMIKGHLSFVNDSVNAAIIYIRRMIVHDLDIGKPESVNLLRQAELNIQRAVIGMLHQARMNDEPKD